MNTTDAVNVLVFLEVQAEATQCPADAAASLKRVAEFLKAQVRKMQTPIGDGGPAYPQSAVYDPHREQVTASAQYGAEAGATLRDYFAARAPEVPEWYRPAQLPPLPPILSNQAALALQPAYAELPEHNKLQLSEWMRDDSWDLDDAVAAIGKAAKDAIAASVTARTAAGNAAETYRFIAWRWRYADLMLHGRAG